MAKAKKPARGVTRAEGTTRRAGALRATHAAGGKGRRGTGGGAASTTRPPATRTGKPKRPQPAARKTAGGSRADSVPEAAVAREVELPPRPRRAEGDGADAERGRYVYCLIRASSPLRFGGIGIGFLLSHRGKGGRA